MFKLVSLSLLASAVALSPASAQGTAKASSDGASSAPAEEKKVCKRVLRSGTNARPKICLTKAEWKKVEDNQH